MKGSIEPHAVNFAKKLASKPERHQREKIELPTCHALRKERERIKTQDNLTFVNSTRRARFFRTKWNEGEKILFMSRGREHIDCVRVRAIATHESLDLSSEDVSAILMIVHCSQNYEVIYLGIKNLCVHGAH